MWTAVRDSHSPGPISAADGGLNPISAMMSRRDKREVKPVAVVGDVHAGLDGPHVGKPGAQQVGFGRDVGDGKRAGEVGFRRVLKVGHVLGHDVAVDDEEAAAVDHVGDHEDLTWKEGGEGGLRNK